MSESFENRNEILADAEVVGVRSQVADALDRGATQAALRSVVRDSRRIGAVIEVLVDAIKEEVD